MKKITVVTGTILAMLVIMVFPCYGEGIPACYQKNNGQLRILTDHKDACRPSEIPITLGGAEGTEVPRICAGTVCYDSNTSFGDCPSTNIVSSCATVSFGSTGHYTIAFNSSFDQPPVCVFYVHPPYATSIIWFVQTDVQESSISIYTFAGYGENTWSVDSTFNFICTEP
jgi:hypothetical protein